MSRNNERLWRVVKVIGLIIIIITGSLAIAKGYGIFTERVNTNRDKIEKVDLRVDEVEQKADTNQDNIIKINTHLEYIKTGVDDIKKEMRIRLTDE